MKIILSNKSDQPIYEQIKDQIKDQIMTGVLPEGRDLPSIRALARELGISVITTTRAYTDLEAEGFIASVQGKGSFVLARDSHLVREQYLKKIETCFSQALEHARYAGITTEELVVILRNLTEENT